MFVSSGAEKVSVGVARRKFMFVVVERVIVRGPGRVEDQILRRSSAGRRGNSWKDIVVGG